jgi:hypothetical protein
MHVSMAEKVIRLSLSVLLTVAALSVSWYCWKRTTIGRFSFHESDSGPLILDTQTGTIHVLIDRGSSSAVWREVKPQTGQSIDRAYQKIN